MQNCAQVLCSGECSQLMRLSPSLCSFSTSPPRLHLRASPARPWPRPSRPSPNGPTGHLLSGPIDCAHPAPVMNAQPRPTLPDAQRTVPPHARRSPLLPPATLKSGHIQSCRASGPPVLGPGCAAIRQCVCTPRHAMQDHRHSRPPSESPPDNRASPRLTACTMQRDEASWRSAWSRSCGASPALCSSHL